MLLDEDPATLIHHTIGNFNIAPDRSAISRINESLSTLQQARDLRLREAESALKRLSRTLITLSAHHEEVVASHSSTAHANQILELDTQKFRVAKAANDAEIESERLEIELEGLRGRLQELEMQGVEGGEGERGKVEMGDETLLKLKVYRSLGIELEAEDGSAEYKKATIRNAAKGDLHVVNVDPKFSRFFYANFFWQMV